MTGPTTVLDLDAASASAVEAIYSEAFPSRQRMPFTEIVTSAAVGERLLMVLGDDSGPIGFGTVLPLPGLQTGYVEYYAIRADARGRGLGGTLWRALLDRAARERDVTAVVFEVEDPAAADDEVEAEMRRRRVRFYERLGARRLPVAGFRAVNLDGTGTEPMHLMWAPARPDVAPPDDLAGLVRAIYEDGYDLPSNTPLIADVIATIG